MRLRSDTEAGSDLWDALVVPNDPVAFATRTPRPPMLLLVDLSRDEFRGDLLVLVEVALETVGRQDLHDPDRLGARVAQGVGHISRLEDVGAHRGDHNLATDIARQLAREHEVAPVLTGVRVWGYQHPLGEALLLDGERTAGAIGRDLMDHVQHGEVCALARADEDLLFALRCHGMLPSVSPT